MYQLWFEMNKDIHPKKQNFLKFFAHGEENTLSKNAYIATIKTTTLKSEQSIGIKHSIRIKTNN